MNKFITEKKKTIWTVGRDKSKSEAITMANEKFRVKRDDLEATYAWEKDDELWFDKVKGAKEVWAVWKH